MEFVQSIQAELAALQAKRTSCSTTTKEELQQLIEACGAFATVISQDTASSMSTQLSILSAQAQSTLSKTLAAQKDKYVATNKYAKLVDKKFKADLNLVFDMHQQQSDINHLIHPTSSDSSQQHKQEQCIQQAIELHLLSDGYFSLAEHYNKELALKSIVLEMEEHPKMKQNFFQLHTMVEALAQRDVQPALEWARQTLLQESLALGHADTFSARLGSKESLEDFVFVLHKCRYIQLLLMAMHQTNEQAASHVKAALEYARVHLRQFAARHTHDIRMLCTAALIVNKPHHPLHARYAHVLSNQAEAKIWKRVQDMLRLEFCSRLGISASSPLYTAAAVGMLALPKIAKLAQVTRANKTEWTQRNELPVEIPVPPSARFHSVFVCPVSKETATATNPPMRMPCGHVLCQDSITRLSRNGGRFKCPYCPNESTPIQASRVFF